MLSDEEKKAIKLFEEYLISGNKEEVLCKNLRTIYTIIEKQSKEIEELNEKNFELEYLDTGKIMENKIKAKIEELEKEQEKNRKDLENAINILYFKEIDKISDRICVNMSVRDILQSLLEKE